MRLQEQINALREAADLLEDRQAFTMRALPGRVTFSEAWEALKANAPKGLATLRVSVTAYEGKPDEAKVEIYFKERWHQATTLEAAVNFMLQQASEPSGSELADRIAETMSPSEQKVCDI